jgi:DNA-binding MarR family transcriptional regulator
MGMRQLNKNSAMPPRGSDSETRITLGLLNAVGGNARVSQRSLAGELGIALGLTNAYLKRCVRKGLVKVAHAPANRYAYYLTPKGFTEKSRLTANYLKHSFDFYRQARAQCDAALAACAEQEWRQLALLGSGELAEIALLCALRHEVEIVGVIDAKTQGDSVLNVPLVRAIGDLARYDAVLLTDSVRPQRTYNELSLVVPADRLLIPDLLGVTLGPNGGGAS